MRNKLLQKALGILSAKKLEDRNVPLVGERLSGVKVKKVNGRAMPYADRHRGNWFKPEYELTELQVAQDTDSFLFKAIQKKVHRFVLAGWEFVGNDKETVTYIKRRIREIETVSGQPFNLLMTSLAHDLIRYSNCAWVKVRNKDASSGKNRKYKGKEIEPVAGYFILPFETLWFKIKRNGEIKKVMQEQPNTGETKEFAPEDIVHFYTNRKPGFTMGTPELLPVLEDIALLRRLEENIEEMIDSNLHPLFHYTVGNDNMPERYGPDGIKETDLVRNTIEYMPSGGIFVSDHRHNIEAIGSEGKALKINEYLDYFKKRVYAGLGVSAIDMGEGDSANRSTANTLSKIAIQDVEALQASVKTFIQTYIINELLIEGGYEDAIYDESRYVHIKFGSVDKEEKSKEENQTIQLWLNKLISQKEARKRLGETPVSEDFELDTHYKLYEEKMALLKLGIREEKQEVDRAAKASNNIARPANQHGVRESPKFNRDDSKLLLDKIKNEKDFSNILNLLEI